MSVDVRLARVGDAPAIGAVFARAFAADPVTSWVTPDDAYRARVLERINTLIARYEGVPRGATYVAVTDGAIVGAAVWQPPRPRVINWRSVPFALRAGMALGRSIPRTTQAGAAAARARPREPHWYLQLLGVEPAAQGAGVGGALVRAHLRLVDASGLPAYLETTAENLAFYGTLGFTVTGEIRIDAGAPVEYSLLRG